MVSIFLEWVGVFATSTSSGGGANIPVSNKHAHTINIIIHCSSISMIVSTKKRRRRECCYYIFTVYHTMCVCGSSGK